MSDKLNKRKINVTQRGFRYIRFDDRYGSKCSLQESSLATEHCIWLGVNGVSRMHLTQDMALDLLPLLHYFVDTGFLPDPLEVE